MNRDIQMLRDVITKLVPLLTGKGLKVTQRGTKAYVKANPKTNKPEVVNIPSIPDNATPDFINAVSGFVDHEVGHVLFTDWKVYGGDGVAIDKFSDEGQALINIHNMIEDPFVERQIVRAFPGAEFNLDRLHRHFLAKITTPALQSAKGNKDVEFSYLMVPMIRALAGQEIFEEFMTSNGYWEHELVKNLHMAISSDAIDLIKNARSTAETLVPAQEIHDILFVRKKREEEEKRKQQQQQKAQKPAPEDEDEGEEQAQQPAESDEETQSQDKPEKKAEEGDGDGERDHEEAGDDAGDAPGEADAEDADDAGENDDTGDNAKDEKSDEQSPDEAEDDTSEDAGSEGEQNADDEEDDLKPSSGKSKAEDDAEDAGEDKSKGASKDDADEGDAGEDGVDEGDADEGDADEGDADENDAEGDADEGDASEDAGEKADAGEDEKKTHTSIDEDEEEEGEYENIDGADGAGEDDDADGNGFGGQSGKSMFDLDPSTFKPVDLSSAIAAEIYDMAKQAVDEAPYSVFTKDEDKIEVFNVPDNIDGKWVPEMDERVLGLVGPMQKDIERMMAAQSRVIRTSGHRSGKLHSASLHRVMQGDARVFQRKEESRSKDTAVMLLVDNSGSMQGSRIIVAMQAAYALATTLERVGIASEIMGFTTGYASKSVCEQADDEYRRGVSFSRTTTTIVMPIFKSFSERVTPIVKRRIAYQLNMQVGMNINIDGESLEYGATRLLPRRETRKVMLVLSDGAPVGSGTGPHLKSVVKNLSGIGIETVGIGIQSNAVKNFYPRSLVLNDVKDLPAAVMGELKRILSK